MLPDPDMLKQVHRRYNPLRDSWVLCSPHRTSRPWQGAQEDIVKDDKPEYDPKCFLCPGNERASGDTNPKYDSTYVFTNDFAAVKPADGPTSSTDDKLDGGLFQAEPVSGTCKVICFSPKHNVTLANMSVPAIEKVIDAWQDVYKQAKADPEIVYCQIFENKGAAMGCSNPHPHGQAWMTSMVPDEPMIEYENLEKYHKKTGGHLLVDYVEKELAAKDTADSRIVDYNDSFVVLVPFWATWPFETMLVSRRRIPSILDLSDKEKLELAEMLHSLTVRYDNLFMTSFPYSMGIHQAFVGGDFKSEVDHLMFHFYPPLLRSATVRKFLVGFELLGMPQRDITPETAAERLRACSTTHYLQQ